MFVSLSVSNLLALYGPAPSFVPKMLPPVACMRLLCDTQHLVTTGCLNVEWRHTPVVVVVCKMCTLLSCRTPLSLQACVAGGGAAGLGAATLAAHTVVKNIVDYANNIFGTFSTVAQSLVASELGKVVHTASQSQAAPTLHIYQLSCGVLPMNTPFNFGNKPVTG